MNGGVSMLKKILKTISERLLPSIDQKADGTGHCHEAAFDPDSFPETMKQQMRKNQSSASKSESGDPK
jgi:hypothetical protein